MSSSAGSQFTFRRLFNFFGQKILPEHYLLTFALILPRNAMLARYNCHCVSVCLSQAGVLRRWLNPESRKQRHTIAQDLMIIGAKDLGEIRMGSP